MFTIIITVMQTQRKILHHTCTCSYCEPAPKVTLLTSVIDIVQKFRGQMWNMQAVQHLQQ